MSIIGVDVGGTFTDVVVFDDGQVRTSKVPTDVVDQSNGFLDGLDAVNVDYGGIRSIVHGTTVATNAVIERKGADVGLITTVGFRDILELRRRDRRQIYGLDGSFQPIIPRDRRIEVDERVGADGSVVTPLDLAAIERAARQLVGAGVRAIAIVFLHSFVNGEHEKEAAEAVSRLFPEIKVITSSDVRPVYGEFERTSTTAISAYVQPLVSHYLGHLVEALVRRGYSRDLLVVQSNGGVADSEVASHLAANTVLSGPAAGVVAAARIGKGAGFSHILTADMGGTSLDSAISIDGDVVVQDQTEISFGMPLSLPMLDIQTIGAGGGSIARVGDDGILTVGPDSAGARPGPACYGHGGDRATITDANLVLGRLSESGALGSEASVHLDRDLAVQVIERDVAGPLRVPVEEAALAIVEVANLNMARAIRLQSVEKGFDPRDFALVPFGGAGPLHASALVRELGLKASVVPLFPGITSALGCILSDFRHDFTETINMNLDGFDEATVRDAYRRQAEQGARLLEAEGIDRSQAVIDHGADMLYDGQSYNFSVSVSGAAANAAEYRSAFTEAYERRFGYALDSAVRIMNITTTVTGVRPEVDLERLAISALPASGEAKPRGNRLLRLRSQAVEAPVFHRFDLAIGSIVSGPAIVEQSDSTLFLDETDEARVDAFGSLIVMPVTARSEQRQLAHASGKVN